MVAATPRRALATNSTARAVVMCSNTTRKRRKALDQRREHRVDEVRFAIEHIDVGLRRFAVHQQRHADLLHARENAVHVLDVGDAGIRMRGGAGRIELDAVDEARSSWRDRSPPAAWRRSGTASAAVRSALPAGSAARMRWR